jgi:glycosyltransferase involved in cell wall biosynthesis
MSYIVDDKKEFLIKIPELQREIDPRNDFKAFIGIVRVLFKEKPDIVHTHLAKAGTVSRIAVWIYNAVSKKRIKTVHTFHGHVLEGYFSSLKSKIFIQIEKILARITDAIIAISQTQKWELTEKYQLTNSDKVHIINLGFDLSRFIKGESKGALRTIIGAEENTFLIGIIGRLTPIKNHHMFLDAATLVKKRYPNKLIKFLIVGDGELRGDLEQYAKKLGIDENVIFYGWEKSIQKVYSDLDLIVLTSNNEGTPVSIIESMASSVPVVTTGVGGIKDLLGRIEERPHRNTTCSICERGILCPKGNANAIADGIAYSMEHNDPMRIKRAKDFVFKKYSEGHLIQRVDRLYRNLLNGC